MGHKLWSWAMSKPNIICNNIWHQSSIWMMFRFRNRTFSCGDIAFQRRIGYVKNNGTYVVIWKRILLGQNVRHDVKEYTTTPKSTWCRHKVRQNKCYQVNIMLWCQTLSYDIKCMSWHQKVWKAHHYIKSTSWRQEVRYDIKKYGKYVMTSESTSRRQKYVMKYVIKSKNTSCHQKVNHDAKLWKIRHDIKK